MDLNVETSEQFLARMILLTREESQITQADSQRLANLAQFGPGPVPPTMPEEHRGRDKVSPVRTGHSLIERYEQ